MGGGKGSSSPTPSSSPYEAELARQATQLYGETDPMRKQLIQQMEGLLQGGDIKQTPMYAPLYSTARSGLETQYNAGKENILAKTPRGGGQVEALGNLESSRAGSVGSLESLISKDLISDYINKAYGMSTGAPQMSMGGLGSAGSSYAARQASMAQSEGQQKGGMYGMMGGLGQGVGSYMGGK